MIDRVVIAPDKFKGSLAAADVASRVAAGLTRSGFAGEITALPVADGGDGTVVFLDWPDGELESGLRQRGEVAYWLRKLRPEVVLGHDPWRRYRLHPDHRGRRPVARGRASRGPAWEAVRQDGPWGPAP